MPALAVLVHDGWYGCGTGAGMSNRRFLEVVATLPPSWRIVILPVWVAPTSSEYDLAWHAASQALLPQATVAPLDNGSEGLHRFGAPANFRMLADSGEAALSRIAVEAMQPVLVVAFDIPFHRLAARVARRQELEVVYVPRSTASLHAPDDHARLRWERDSFAELLAAGGRVGTISSFMTRHLVDCHRIPARALLPVYDGVTADEWAPVTPPIRLPCEAEQGFLLAMGRAAPYKGFEDVLDALMLLRAGGVRVPHMVLAAVTEQAELSEHQRELTRRIAVDRLDVTLIRRFDLGARALVGHPGLKGVVVPSRVEAFGRIPMEVFAHPTATAPVIASSAGGLAEIVIEGVTGFSFAPGNSRSLAGALARALQATPAQIRHLRDSGRALIQKNHDYTRNVRAFISAGATGPPPSISAPRPR